MGGSLLEDRLVHGTNGTMSFIIIFPSINMVDPREQHRQLYRRQSNSNYTGNYTGGNRTTTITEITAKELSNFNNFYLL